MAWPSEKEGKDSQLPEKKERGEKREKERGRERRRDGETEKKARVVGYIHSKVPSITV